MEEPGGDFDQVEEHADNADVEIVLGVATPTLVSMLRGMGSVQAYKLLHTTGVLTGR